MQFYNYNRGGSITSKVKYAYTEGELGTAVETIPYTYGDSNWKDKLTSCNGKAITYDAIGNPLNDGERQYEWEAGRRLKKLIVKSVPAEGIEDGFDEGSATTLKLEFSNGNLLANGVTDTVITAKVYRKGEEVTDEYAATAFNWARTTGNESADASWNAAHSGMKSITVSANELTDDIQIQCTLTGTSPAYGSVDVNDSFIASHTRGEADSNDTLSIEDGALFVTTDDDNYRLSGNELTALYPRLNGSVTANAWVYHSQPTKTIEFKYNSAGLRVQKKVTANGKTEVTDYTLHGKLVTHMTVGNDNLHFFYDAQSRPTKVNFNGTTYTYLHNLQGDIVGIIDKSGVLVVEYKYDAWGKLLSSTGSLVYELGRKNPFHYRGYIYDSESELYYTANRLYDPGRCRFIVCDRLDILRINLDSRRDKNPWLYCDNGPIIREDSTGSFWLISIAIGVAAQYVGDVIGNVVSGKKGKDIWKRNSSIGEYIAAGVTALIPGHGIVGALVRNVVSEGICAAEKWINGEEVRVTDSLISVAAGTVLDVGFEKISDEAVEYISSKAPKNYSSYAHDVRQTDSSLTVEQVRVLMRRSARANRCIIKIVVGAIEITRVCMPY